MPGLDVFDDLWLLNLGDDENRFSPSLIDTALSLLDHAATHAPDRSLVTVASGSSGPTASTSTGSRNIRNG